jgi:hypothetical protein
MAVDRKRLRRTLEVMKNAYEQAVMAGNNAELIRSQRLIGYLHAFVLEELRKRLNPGWILREKKVYGLPKIKEQDIVVEPPPNLTGVSVGPMMAINIRSQLSSIAKNYDTLLERIFAEALNLHNRFPYMVLGYLYLLPKIGYSEKEAKKKQVAFSERYNLEKYIISFESIANRLGPSDAPWKYEKVCLLLVDFESSPPIVIDDMKALAKEGIVSEDFVRDFSFEHLRIDDFFEGLCRVMTERYYLLDLSNQTTTREK